DLTEALSWQQKAAAAGNASAQSTIGNMYYNGLGVSKDDTTAVTWWKQAAEHGDSEAACSMSYAYKMGFGGLPKDYVQAEKWHIVYKLHPKTNCFEDSEIVAVMTPEQRMEALRL